jgi:hypothetical protein
MLHAVRSKMRITELRERTFSDTSPASGFIALPISLNGIAKVESITGRPLGKTGGDERFLK